MDQCPDRESNIVGPSDHYGIHPYNNNNNDVDNRNPKQSNLYLKPQDETKICVIVDSRTPIILKVPLPPSNITLADFKQALPAIDQPSYKYFFKSNDSEFGIVREEILDDDGILPTYRNRVVAWVVTPGQLQDELTPRPKYDDDDNSNMTYTCTSYDDRSSTFMTSDIDSTSFTETDDDSVSGSNYSETTCDTFVSQKMNRHYRDNGRSPSNHYHEQVHHSPRLYPNQRDRNRTIDNLSESSSPTSSSATDSDATAVQYLTVHLVLTNKNFLGLHIYANAVDGVDEGIYVDVVSENSAVAIDGRIEPGDKLIQVNEVNLEELSNDEAVKVLKDSVDKRGPLKLVVAKFLESNKNEAIVGINGPNDTIHPIDTAAWVAHTQAITIPSFSHDHANSTTSSPSFGSNAQDTDCIRPASAGINMMGSGLRLNKSTTDIKDIIQHMKIPDIGLNIRDREWLKILIPKAFLGSELVSWLERNVYGFKNSREAKKFASKMMKEGYIRDPISKKSFSSKSYYTFPA